MRPRRKTQAMAGRHADPVDQADAILWAEDLRLRALSLIWEQDAWMKEALETGQSTVTAELATRWMSQAYCVLREVSRG